MSRRRTPGRNCASVDCSLSFISGYSARQFPRNCAGHSHRPSSLCTKRQWLTTSLTKPSRPDQKGTGLMLTKLVAYLPYFEEHTTAKAGQNRTQTGESEKTFIGAS